MLQRLALTLVVALATLGVNAQVDAQFTQYWAVPTYYNAGAVGNIDFIHITAGSRLQWLGIEHSPKTFVAMADMPFKFFERRWGTGVVLQQESMGLFKSVLNQSFNGDSTYIPSNDQAHSTIDDAIPEGRVNGTAFDVSAGIMYTHKKFWVGVSATHLTAPTVTMRVGESEDKVYEFDVGRTYYFMAGGNIPIKNTLFEIQPSVMVKTDLQFTQAEATARVRYNKFLSAGVGYRHKDAVSLMFGANVKDFFIGYSYDYATSAISKASSGTHELFVTYNVKLDMKEKNKNKHKSIRIM